MRKTRLWFGLSSWRSSLCFWVTILPQTRHLAEDCCVLCSFLISSSVPVRLPQASLQLSSGVCNLSFCVAVSERKPSVNEGLLWCLFSHGLLCRNQLPPQAEAGSPALCWCSGLIPPFNPAGQWTQTRSDPCFMFLSSEFYYLPSYCFFSSVTPSSSLVHILSSFLRCSWKNRCLISNSILCRSIWPVLGVPSFCPSAFSPETESLAISHDGLEIPI